MFLRKLSIASMAILICGSVFADEKLEPLVVESSIFSVHTDTEDAQTVKIITADELDRKNVTTLGDAVNLEPGISSTHFTTGASRPIIRGQSDHRVMVLENGVSSSDVSSISDDHAVTIEPHHAQQIEILRGPATLRYGSGAVGGLVNVINKRIPQALPEKAFNLDLTAEHASVSEGNTLAIDANGSVQNFSWHFDALSRDTEDYDIDGYADEDEPENKGKLENSAIDTENYGIGGSYISDQFLFGFSYSHLDSSYGIPGHAHEEEEEEHAEEEEHDEEEEEGGTRLDLKQKRYDAQLEFFSPFANIENILFRTTYTDYTHTEDEALEEEEEEHEGEEEEHGAGTTYDNETWNSRLEIVQHSSDTVHNAFGLQYIDNEFAAVGEETFIAPVDQIDVGVFAISKRTFNDWDVELGARLDRIEYDIDTDRDQDFTTTSLSLGLVNYISDDMLIKFNADMAERAPQNVALYADGAHLATSTYEIGSADLDEETAYSFDLGLEHIGPDYGWKLNAFYSYITDYIYLANTDTNRDGIADTVNEDNVIDLDEELLRGVYSNADAIFYGVEAELSKSLYSTDGTDISGRIFADYVRGEFDDDDLGNVPRMTPARLGLQMIAQYGDWDTSISSIFVSEQNKVAQLETKTDDYIMLNARLGRTIHGANSNIKVFVKGENLLDEDARQHTSLQKDHLPLPGRNISVGMSLHY